MICEHIHDDGAYVLGALAPAERAAYERHLAGCPACREAVAEIAVLPGLLSRLDADGLAQITPPSTAPARIPALLDAARRERRQQRRARRWRYAGTALVAACLALVVGLGAAWLSNGGGPPATGTGERLTAMQVVRDGSPVTAEIGLRGTDWGTKVTMHCHYEHVEGSADENTFHLVAEGPNGATEQVGSWVAGPGHDVTVTGVTRFSAAELVRLKLTRQDGTALLAYDVP